MEAPQLDRLMEELDLEDVFGFQEVFIVLSESGETIKDSPASIAGSQDLRRAVVVWVKE